MSCPVNDNRLIRLKQCQRQTKGTGGENGIQMEFFTTSMMKLGKHQRDSSRLRGKLKRNIGELAMCLHKTTSSIYLIRQPLHIRTMDIDNKWHPYRFGTQFFNETLTIAINGLILDKVWCDPDQAKSGNQDKSKGARSGFRKSKNFDFPHISTSDVELCDVLVSPSNDLDEAESS
ncbi:hypothetical protein PS2_021940 [Malus domestica]